MALVPITIETIPLPVPGARSCVEPTGSITPLVLSTFPGLRQHVANPRQRIPVDRTTRHAARCAADERDELAPSIKKTRSHGTIAKRAGRQCPDPPGLKTTGWDLPQQACWRCFMIKAGLSPTRLRRKVLALCAEANYVGDLISELAHEARDQQQALLLAGRAHRIAIEAVSPEIFGHVFAADEGEED